MAAADEQTHFPFTRKNWIFFGIGLAVISLGYVMLSIPPADGFWSLNMAPLLLIGGYCVLIPIAILTKDRTASEDDRGSA